MTLFQLTLFSLLFSLKISSAFDKNSNVGLTPIVKVKASFNSCIKCQPGSHIDKIIESTGSVPYDVTCNGFIYNELSYDYKTYITAKSEALVLSQLHNFCAFLNGNVVSIANGYISNGTCAGDYIYSVSFSIADDQNGCNSDNGVRQQRIIWNMIQIIGNCGSLCYGKGLTTLTPAISNKGKVDY